MIYAYRCDEHGLFDSMERGDRHPCDTCGTPSRRIWHVPDTAKVEHFEAHWNPAVGQVVTSMADFRNKAEEAAAAYNKRTGDSDTFRVVDPREIQEKAPEPIALAAEATRKSAVDSGRVDAKKTVSVS